MTGKGSSPRPKSVSDEEFGKRFDAIDWAATQQAPADVPDINAYSRGIIFEVLQPESSSYDDVFSTLMDAALLELVESNMDSLRWSDGPVEWTATNGVRIRAQTIDKRRA